MLYGATYVIFTIIYHVSGGTCAKDNPYIYPTLNWNNTKRTALFSAGAIFVLLPVVWVILCGVSRLKVVIITGSCREQNWHVGLHKEEQSDHPLFPVFETKDVQYQNVREVPMMMELQTVQVTHTM